jgi:diaminohydroxyphosphoribosylaminopyrimidine deaminase / 5-amino-6-(5-phosphoribosylamino)uracil reductase
MYHKFQRRCFDIARLGIGATLTNPPVGSIIVKNGKTIIGEGWHRKFGEAHAEVNAVADAMRENSDFTEDIIYVSLEPCFHYSKTPPCVDLILKHQFKEVNITAIDPNPKVLGKSTEKLLSNNIKLKYDTNLNNLTTILRNPYNEKTLIPFLIHNQLKRPFIILKWAESQDGFMGKENKQIQISNQFSKRLVHKMRAECDAILVGTKTVLIDNPKLDNRFFFGKSPKRVIFDRSLKLEHSLNIYDKSVDTIIFTEKIVKKNDSEENLTFHQLEFDKDMLPNMLSVLYHKNVGVLLVEGGEKLLTSFIDQGLWDRACVIKSGEILRGGLQSPKISEVFFSSQEKLDDNAIHFYKNENHLAEQSE